MKTWIKIAEFFGILNKARTWVQGKKEMAANLAQVIGGLVAMMAMAGHFLELVAKSLTIITGWGDGQATSESVDSIGKLWSDHSMLVAGFSGGFYAVTDGVSKMARRAYHQRTEKTLSRRS